MAGASEAPSAKGGGVTRRQRRASPADAPPIGMTVWSVDVPGRRPTSPRPSSPVARPAGRYDPLKYSSEPMNAAMTFSSWTPFCIEFTQ